MRQAFMLAQCILNKFAMNNKIQFACVRFVSYDTGLKGKRPTC